jgi:hypothetical protein
MRVHTLRDAPLRRRRPQPDSNVGSCNDGRPSLSRREDTKARPGEPPGEKRKARSRFSPAALARPCDPFASRPTGPAGVLPYCGGTPTHRRTGGHNTESGGFAHIWPCGPSGGQPFQGSAPTRLEPARRRRGRTSAGCMAEPAGQGLAPLLVLRTRPRSGSEPLARCRAAAYRPRPASRSPDSVSELQECPNARFRDGRENAGYKARRYRCERSCRPLRRVAQSFGAFVEIPLTRCGATDGCGTEPPAKRYVKYLPRAGRHGPASGRIPSHRP